MILQAPPPPTPPHTHQKQKPPKKIKHKISNINNWFNNRTHHFHLKKYSEIYRVAIYSFSLHIKALNTTIVILDSQRLTIEYVDGHWLKSSGNYSSKYCERYHICCLFRYSYSLRYNKSKICKNIRSWMYKRIPKSFKHDALYGNYILSVTLTWEIMNIFMLTVSNKSQITHARTWVLAYWSTVIIIVWILIVTFD